MIDPDTPTLDEVHITLEQFDDEVTYEPDGTAVLFDGAIRHRCPPGTQCAAASYEAIQGAHPMTDPTQRWEFVQLNRQPSGFGVARLTLRHPTQGAAIAHLTVQELRHLAALALDAMDTTPALERPE